MGGTSLSMRTNHLAYMVKVLGFPGPRFGSIGIGGRGRHLY